MFFYAGGRILVSPCLDRLQSVLDMMTGLFERVVPHTNFNRKVGMVCQPCQMVGGNSELEYTWGMTGVGPSFQEREQERLRLPD